MKTPGVARGCAGMKAQCYLLNMQLIQATLSKLHC